MIGKIAVEGAAHRAAQRPPNNLDNEEQSPPVDKKDWGNWPDWDDYDDFPNWDNIGGNPPT